MVANAALAAMAPACAGLTSVGVVGYSLTTLLGIAVSASSAI